MLTSLSGLLIRLSSRSGRPRPLTSAASIATPTHPDARPVVELTLAAATIGLIFGLAFVVPQPVWHGQPARPSSTGGPATDVWTSIDLAGFALAITYAVAWSLPFRPYTRALGLAHAVGGPTLVALTTALALVALLVFPSFGSDLFIYVDYARLWALYGEHPLLAAPSAQPADWAFQFIWLPYQPSPYGPLWAALTWPIARLAGTSIAANVTGYKVLAVVGYVACCWLIWTWPARQTQRARALVMFAWSPLVLFETLAKAHNDVLLALAALLAFRLSGGGAGGPVVAVLGGLVKATGLALLPSLVVSLARSRAWPTLGVGMVVGCAVAVAAYAPLWQGPSTLLPILAQTSRVVWSPGSLLIAAGVDAGAVRLLLAVAWAAMCGLILWRVRDPPLSGCLVLLASLLMLTTAFFAHYLVPVIGLAAVSDHPRLQHAVLALSIGALAAYAVEVLNLAFGPSFIGSPSFQVVGSLVLLVPVCLALRSRPRPIQ